MSVLNENIIRVTKFYILENIKTLANYGRLKELRDIQVILDAEIEKLE